MSDFEGFQAARTRPRRIDWDNFPSPYEAIFRKTTEDEVRSFCSEENIKIKSITPKKNEEDFYVEFETKKDLQEILYLAKKLNQNIILNRFWLKMAEKEKEPNEEKEISGGLTTFYAENNHFHLLTEEDD